MRIVKKTVDDPVLWIGDGNTGIPESLGGPGGLMALDAVGGEIRTDPVFETDSKICRVGESREQLAVGDDVAEITGKPQRFEFKREEAGKTAAE